MEIKAFSSTGDQPIDEKRGAFRIVPQPPRNLEIVAIEGAAVDGGFEVALSCGLLMAGDDATFGFPEVRRGLTTAGDEYYAFPRALLTT